MRISQYFRGTIESIDFSVSLRGIATVSNGEFYGDNAKSLGLDLLDKLV